MREFPSLFPVTCHTRYVGAGSTFVAINGYSTNGALYIKDALERGAKKIVLENVASLDATIWQAIYHYKSSVEEVANARKSLAILSAQAADYPAKKLKVIGITGTKGKTTTAMLAFHMLRASGISSAVISSVGNAINAYQYKPFLTTPQPDYLHQFLKLCVDAQVEWVVIEVAAHAISLHRIDGIEFDVVIITNIAQEHLEFYPDLDTYAAAKIALLSYRKKGALAWLNKNDERLIKIDKENLCYFALDNVAHITGKMVAHKESQLNLEVVIMEEKKMFLSCPLLFGEYNATNIIAAVAAIQEAKIIEKQIVHALATFQGVPGRFETYRLPNESIAIIDYAHNPFSYNALFTTLRSRTNHLIVVFGAGGDRDQSRRPQMGSLVAQYADVAIITTDNPRFEDPQKIVEDIIKGIDQNKLEKVIIESDREQAIRLAYERSSKGSIIALIGKGPDEYQLIGNAKIPFSERAIITSFKQ